VAIIFGVSRIAYSLAGVRFDSSSLEYSWQLLDPAVLSDRLTESLWYLHAQPPAFNAFVGVVLRFSPWSPTVTFQIAYLIAGLVLFLAVHDLARQLRVGRWAALIVATVICCGPPVVLYENSVSYEYPVAAMLVVVVDLAVRYYRNLRAGTLVGMASVAALAVLTRSALHPVWLLALVAVVFLYCRPPLRRALGWIVVPLLIVALVMVKNEAVFGEPQLSSWLGYSLHRVMIEPLRADQVDQLKREGLIDRNVDITQPGDQCVRRYPGVPALANPLKHQGTSPDDQNVANFNDECDVASFGRSGDEALQVARAHPAWAASNIGGSFEVWAMPSSLVPQLTDRRPVAAADTWYRRLILGDLVWEPPIPVPVAFNILLMAPDHHLHISLTLIFATILALAGSVATVIRWRQRSGARLGILVGGATVGFVTMASNFLEHGENNRIRFIVEPLTYVLAAALLAAVWRRWQRSRIAKRATAPGLDVEAGDEQLIPSFKLADDDELDREVTAADPR
jgi:hypothetical protein